jgi:hypothetical protein
MTSYQMVVRLFIAGVMFAGAALIGGSAKGALTFSTSTDKQEYVVGETLNVLVKAENSSDQDVHLVFSSGYQADYLMDGVDLWSSHRGFIQAITGKTVPAHGSYTWALPHAWNYYSPAVGTHSVIGRVVGFNYTAAAEFSVVPVLSQTDPAPLPEPGELAIVGLVAGLMGNQRRRSLRRR